MNIRIGSVVAAGRATRKSAMLRFPAPAFRKSAAAPI